LREALEGLAAENPTLGELLSSERLTGPLLERLEAAVGLPVRPLIEGLLGEEPQQVLENGLGSVNLSELLAKLLGSAENPRQLIDHLLEALNPATLESLLGSLPTGEPPQNMTVGELAGGLSRTLGELAQALGQAASALPATAAAATRGLEGDSELAAINGLEGLGMALISKASEGLGGPGGTGGGSIGGNGGSPGSTVAIVPGGAPPATAGGSPSSPRPANAGKLKILSSKTRGKRATIVVQVPGAGTLTLSGSGIKRVSREASQAERMTLAVTLTKTRSASLRKHHRKSTKVTLTVAFLPVSGATSKATRRIALH